LIICDKLVASLLLFRRNWLDAGLEEVEKTATTLSTATLTIKANEV
jgi:hypothetical protein